MNLQAKAAALFMDSLDDDKIIQALREQVESQQQKGAAIQEEQDYARLFMSAIDQSSESIMFTDAAGLILYVNRTFEETSGYSREEVMGKTPSILKSDHHGPAFYKEMWDTLLKGDVFHGRFINRRKDGTIFHEEAHISPVKTKEGKINSFVAVKTNITQLLENQRILEETNAELTRSNAELGQFAYVASHDLQEPLRSVSSCLQLLKKRYGGQIDDRADEFINHAVAGAQRMRTLIDALLTLSRVNASNEPLETTDTANILQQVIANLSETIRESGAGIHIGVMPVINGCPQMLNQLFQNLISNAIKFRNEAPPQIRIEAKQKKNEWVFSVMDDGIGIETQHFDRIFLLFQRLHTRTEYAGTGLGLAICQKIVERHNGRIWVESSAGHGSTFFFTLPE